MRAAFLVCVRSWPGSVCEPPSGTAAHTAAKAPFASVRRVHGRSCVDALASCLSLNRGTIAAFLACGLAWRRCEQGSRRAVVALRDAGRAAFLVCGLAWQLGQHSQFRIPHSALRIFQSPLCKGSCRRSRLRDCLLDDHTAAFPCDSTDAPQTGSNSHRNAHPAMPAPLHSRAAARMHPRQAVTATAARTQSRIQSSRRVTTMPPPPQQGTRPRRLLPRRSPPRASWQCTRAPARCQAARPTILCTHPLCTPIIERRAGVWGRPRGPNSFRLASPSAPCELSHAEKAINQNRSTMGKSSALGTAQAQSPLGVKPRQQSPR